MERFKPRTPVVTAGLAACGLAVAVALSGCGAGQVSQMATQEPAVNGTTATVGPISLRNVHLRAAQSTDYVEPGGDAELLFVAVNGSPDVNDKLVSVTSDIGTVSISGDSSLPANGVLVVGEPDGQIAPLESAEKSDVSQAKVVLSKPIMDALTAAGVELDAQELEPLKLSKREPIQLYGVQLDTQLDFTDRTNY